MKIENIEISKLKPYEKNAKAHPKSQVEAIARSIKAFGFNQPVVVSAKNEVIVGHGRMLAAISLGMFDVPAIRAKDLTAQQIRAYRLADNKLNESDWDMALVTEELKALKLEGFDITLTGFDDDLTLETAEDDQEKLDEAMGIGGPKAKVGDLYQLGDHRIYCGDSTDAASYRKLLGKEKARMIFTDPPYGISYSDSDGEGIMNDDKKGADLVSFFIKVLVLMKANTADDATLYWWFADRFSGENAEAWRKAGWKWSQNVIWLKNGPTWSPSQLYMPIKEPCMVGWKDGGGALSGLPILEVLGAVDARQEIVRGIARPLVRKARSGQNLHPSHAEAGAPCGTRHQEVLREKGYRAGYVRGEREYHHGVRTARTPMLCHRA